MSDLSQKHCIPCEGGIPPLEAERIKELMPKIPEWQVSDDQKWLSRKFTFKDYYHTIAFVNAIAWMAHRENHHPDLQVGYDHCTVQYTTHAIDGLSENDVVCALKVDTLFKGL